MTLRNSLSRLKLTDQLVTDIREEMECVKAAGIHNDQQAREVVANLVSDYFGYSNNVARDLVDLSLINAVI